MANIGIDMVRAHIDGNDFYNALSVKQGNDLFVPSQVRYPHLHIGKNFITYSKTSTNHSEIVAANGFVNEGRLITMLQDSNSAEIKQVARYIMSQKA